MELLAVHGCEISAFSLLDVVRPSDLKTSHIWGDDARHGVQTFGLELQSAGGGDLAKERLARERHRG